MQRRRALAAAAWSLAPGAARAAAERFPQRPVRLVVPYSVGVGPDVVARSVGAHLSRRWEQPVWVDNRPGASGIVAFADVRRTAPDGHTLFLGDTATLAVNPLLHATLPYDPQRDLVPLSLLVRATFLLWTGGSNRHATLAQLLDAARREPGRVSYATLGNGHASHVAVETFARAAGVQMLHVPFKDVGALMTAVVAGEVDITTFGLNTMAGLYAQGRLRPLAVAARQRLAALPAVPTLPEAGGPPVEMHPWAALLAVAGTPAPVLAQLELDIAAALAAPDVRQPTEQAGFELTPSTPQALRERMLADAALYAPLVNEGRIARL
jgi:tripartite-type tricarboxylate transporter receptor subunit TctC